ncbi:MAG: alpha-L-fucosidase [Planctomycetaceae bacterium]|jgi:alpha-L-fucosidase|nr:alpha-L-fucosidase [Planctomycetaceae bacterium]
MKKLNIRMTSKFYRTLLFGMSLLICSVAFGQKTVTPEDVQKDRARNIVVPKSYGTYKWTKDYVEEEPEADYLHASEKAYEDFRDIKYSIRIHWGVYSKWGIEASWPFLKMSNEKKQEYQDLYKSFNPADFNADEWMDWFKNCGMQAFAFTTKHHDGFSMFHTKTRVTKRANYVTGSKPVIEDCDLSYSIEETPFKRDIVKELCDAAHRKGIKIDLYFSHPDWYDADFRPYVSHPLGNIAHTPEEANRFMSRHREQLHELLTMYGKIDMICLDMSLGAEVWPQLRETVKLMRTWQPDVMIRNRGIGNYGDYFQPEQNVPKGVESTNMPWMSICLLGKIFAYDPKAENYKGAGWVIHNLIDCVAKGGSFMVCLGPDEKGKFHPKAIEQLEEVGRWLKVNGKGIYETRDREVWKEGGNEGNIKFTRSKDSKTVYAFVEKFPEKELVIESLTPKDGSEVRLLGYDKPLEWRKADDKGIIVTIPDELQSPEKRPCNYAWTFKLEPAN